jgi:UDP-N-acetylmuramate--alanine ligase
MFFRANHFHFIGIGGIGMSGIAELLLSLGYRVSGSDLRRGPVTDRLAGLGATIFEGHGASNVEGAAAVVASSAVQAANPEVVEARRRGIPVIPRGEMLAELMRLKFGIAVAGSHGKTTTTSMIAAVMSHAGLDPTIVVGGRVDSIGSNARLGGGDYMVVESDESDGSFLKLAPILAVITTIDREHLDHYRDLEEIRRAYTYFANRVPFYGATIVCADDPNIQAILPLVTRRVIRYGTSAHCDGRSDLTACDLTATEIVSEGFGSRFRLGGQSGAMAEFTLPVPGRHNVMNAMAAIAVGLELGAPLGRIREALAGYGGVDRRFQVRGRARGVTVIDDYGHHPTEVGATLAAAKQVVRSAGRGRVLVAFQPHRYSRTCLLMDEFAHAFTDADELWITDIYAAGEQPIEGISGQALVEATRAAGLTGVRYAPDFDTLADDLAKTAQDGDLIIALGAGNINHICEKMFLRLAPQFDRGE